jgi:hypothetical protein
LGQTLPKGISIKFNLPENLHAVSADATQLHQVLMNLCVNARDAMPDGGILKIALRNVVLDEESAAAIHGAKPGPRVLLRVSDTGGGIPPESIERIFEPFYTTKETGKGTGLGLSTVLGIVQSHDGVIQVNSRSREGTDFLIYLPAIEAVVDHPETQDHSSVPKGEGELILIADDDASIRSMCKKLLEKNGYRVLLAKDGLQAVELFQQHKHDVRVVLTDLAMPRMDGLTLIHALRAEPPFPRIIATSGMVTEADAEEFKNIEVDAILHKPITVTVLLKALRTSIQRYQETVPRAC